MIRGRLSALLLPAWILPNAKQTERQIIRQGAALKEINYELSVLHSVSSAVSRTIDMNELLPIVLSTVTGISVFAVQRKGGIFIIEGDRMKLASHLGHSDEFLALHKDLKVGASSLRPCRENRRDYCIKEFRRRQQAFYYISWAPSRTCHCASQGCS